MNPQARIFETKGAPVLILVSGRAGARRLKALRAVADQVKVCGRTEIDFRQALAWLRQSWKVKRLLCEGGGELNDALLRAGVVDELHVTITPFIFGGRAAPTIADGRGAVRLSRATHLQLQSARHRGQELFLVYRACSPQRAKSHNKSDKRFK